MEIVTSNPEVAAKAFSNGTMLSSLLTPLGFTINPATVSVRARCPAVLLPFGARWNLT
jgi:hypothetical protein